MLWENTVEKDVNVAGKSWRNKKAMTAHTVCWYCFFKTLCSGYGRKECKWLLLKIFYHKESCDFSGWFMMTVLNSPANKTL